MQERKFTAGQKTVENHEWATEPPGRRGPGLLVAKPRRQQQRGRHQAKDLMSRTMAVHMRYNS